MISGPPPIHLCLSLITCSSDYLTLKSLRNDFPQTPISALTATANQTVVDDCIRILGLRNPFRHSHSFNRPNIEYCVRIKDSKVISSIAEIIKKRRDQTGQSCEISFLSFFVLTDTQELFTASQRKKQRKFVVI